MEKIYKYRFSRRTIYWTLIYLVVFGLLGGLLYHLYEGGYLSAWFTSFIVALIALMSLSIPRYIVVTDEKVEVRCLLDITEIKRGEIASVRRVDPKRMKWFFPLFGGCGFFGYYGHFLDLRRFERVRLYASEWKNFVEITDIYEERLYVSCSDADCLVAELMPVSAFLLNRSSDLDRRGRGRRGGGTGGSADRKGDADNLRNAGDIRRHPICGSDGMPDRKNGPKRREYAINCIIPKSTHFLFT